jgi:hypothetical protein
MSTHAGSLRGFLVAMVLAAAAGGCRKGLDDQGQIGASVGDVMASADESVSGGAATAMLPGLPILRTPSG